MIRMGRNSRTDSTDSSDLQAQPTDTGYRYQAAVATPAAAITESDSMARDIKEGRLSGFVGHGTTLTGETDFHAMLRVDGHLIGTVSSSTGTLIIGTNGQVDANILVAAAMINGTVNGDILATEKLHLGRTARVIGNIQTPRLIVEEGAILEGGCNMLQAREKQEDEVAAASAKQVAEPATPAYSTTASVVADDEDEAASLFDEDDDDEAADVAAA